MNIITDIQPIEIVKSTSLKFKVTFGHKIGVEQMTRVSMKLSENLMERKMMMGEGIGANFITGFFETCASDKSLEENVYGFIESVTDLNIEVVEIWVSNRPVDLPE